MSADHQLDEIGHVDLVDLETLTACALASDPDDFEFDDDAEPFGVPATTGDLLPNWYMPAPLAGIGGQPRRTWIAVGVSIALVVVNGFGLCVTYGVPEVGDRLVSFW